MIAQRTPFSIQMAPSYLWIGQMLAYRRTCESSVASGRICGDRRFTLVEKDQRR